MSHAMTCRLVQRAEARGPCDCGAVDDRPYRLRMVNAVDDTGKQMLELVFGESAYLLTSAQAVELGLALMELTRLEGERWSRRKRS